MDNFFIVVNGWTSSYKRQVGQKLALKFETLYFSEKSLILSFLKFITFNHCDTNLEEVDYHLKTLTLDKDGNFYFNDQKIILAIDDFQFQNTDEEVTWESIGQKYLNPKKFPNLWSLVIKLLNSFNKLVLSSYFLITEVKKPLIILFLKVSLAERCRWFIEKNKLFNASIIAFSKYINDIDDYLIQFSPFFKFYFHKKNLKIYQIENIEDINLLVERIYSNICG